MSGFELFLPCVEVFNGNWSKSSEFWPFKYFFGFLFDLEVGFVSSALNEEINNPKSDFFNDFIDNGFVSIFVDEVLDSFGDCNEIVSGDSSHGFDVILDGSFGVGLGVFEVEGELILELMGREVRPDKY